MNIAFHYIYRDGANYKNFETIVFSNQDDFKIEELENLIKSKFFSGEYFYVSELHLPDLHFGTWDDEIDHTFHEFEMIEYTDEPPNTLLTLAEFIQLIEKTNWVY